MTAKKKTPSALAAGAATPSAKTAKKKPAAKKTAKKAAAKSATPKKSPIKKPPKKKPAKRPAKASKAQAAAKQSGLFLQKDTYKECIDGLRSQGLDHQDAVDTLRVGLREANGRPLPRNLQTAQASNDAGMQLAA